MNLIGGDEPRSVAGVVRWMAGHPWEALGRRWNYKAAILSATMRAWLFFVTNAGAGHEAAVAAMLTEFVFRISTAGFYGAMTQAFRRVEPAAVGTAAAMVLLPLAGHSLEFLVHWWRGTPALGLSIGASVAFTALSTAFNLFAMRHGVFVVGRGHQSILADLAAVPRLLALFVAGAARTCWRGLA